MSHFSTLRSKLTDTVILKTTLQDLGLTVKTESYVRGTNGQQARADLVAVLEGDYDLGWNRNADGSLSLIADLWGVSIRHDIAELMNSINQKYAINQTLASVKRPGLQSANVRLVVQ